MASGGSSLPTWAAQDKRSSRREYKKRVTRQRLLDSAWGLFREHGYDETTIEEIASGADIAKSTFFNYFESKQALLDEIALQQIEQTGVQALAGENVPESAVARIKLVTQAVLGALSSEQDLTQRIFWVRISTPVKHEGAHRVGTIVQKLVVQGQSDREIRTDIDPALVARLLMTCIVFSAWQHQAETSECQHGREGRVEKDTDLVAMERELTASIDALMAGLGGPEWRQE